MVQALEKLETVHMSTARNFKVDTSLNRSQLVTKENMTPTHSKNPGLMLDLSTKMNIPPNEKRESFPLPARPALLTSGQGGANKDYYPGGGASKSPNYAPTQKVTIPEKDAGAKPNFSKLMLQYGKGAAGGAPQVPALNTKGAATNTGAGNVLHSNRQGQPAQAPGYLQMNQKASKPAKVFE
jgi:hypothetical protein